MSNLIKYPFVNLSGKEKVMIDSENIADHFVSFHQKPEEEPESDPEKETGIEEEPGFQPGIDVIKAEQIFEEERKKALDEAEMILNDARKQADLLLDSAKSEAVSMRETARTEGYNEGYAAGEVEARQACEKLQQELNEKIRSHEVEYVKMLEDIEPKYVDILISLLQKLTGVLLEDRKEIILYLISNSIRNLDKASHYIIRVSTEDSPFIDLHRNEIREIIGKEASVEFFEEKSLKHNECMIETDSQMVDCGFQTQLNNLIETLKMFVV